MIELAPPEHCSNNGGGNGGGEDVQYLFASPSLYFLSLLHEMVLKFYDYHTKERTSARARVASDHLFQTISTARAY